MKKDYVDVVLEDRSFLPDNLNLNDFFFRFHFLNLTPPSICTNSAEMQISSTSFERRIRNSDFLIYQVRELISILYDLQNSNISGPSNTEST